MFRLTQFKNYKVFIPFVNSTSPQNQISFCFDNVTWNLQIMKGAEHTAGYELVLNQNLWKKHYHNYKLFCQQKCQVRRKQNIRLLMSFCPLLSPCNPIKNWSETKCLSMPKLHMEALQVWQTLAKKRKKKVNFHLV